MVVEDDNEAPVAKSNKYSDTLKTFLPYRRAPSKKDVLPSTSAGLFSFLTMSWMTTLMWKALKTGLTKEDLWELPEIDRSEHNAKRLRRIWENEKRIKKDKALFRNAIWAFGRTRFYMCIALIIISVIFQFLGPAWILKSILNFIDDESSPIEIGLALAVIAFAVQIIRNLSFGAFWIIGIHTAMRVEGAIQFMTYEKLLRLRNGSEKILSQAVTFCTNDTERIFECVAGGILALAAPVMFILSLTYSCIIIGPWALLGNFIIFLFYPLMGIVARSIGNIRRNTVKITNSRIQVTSEILNSIRLIKMYSWEESFAKTVGDLRAKEQKELRTSAFLQSLTCTFTPLTNIISSIVTFLGFSLSGNDLTAENVFTIFSIFSALQFTIGTLPFAVRSIAESSVSFSNFQKYLDLPEYSQEMNENIVCDHDSVIIIQNGSFSWPFSNDGDTNTNVVKKDTKKKQNGKNSVKKEQSNMEKIETEEDKNEDESKVELIENEEKMIKCLSNINMEIKRGKLIGIAGSVGSGKSALLSALLGDVIKNEGDILIRGSLAIVTQQAWIYNGSIQENILFGLPLNKEKYEAVVSVCCLKSDIDRLPNGDQTVIGERGFNLSGGQKSRLNLARSVYSDRSIYLLDDPLSSVDNRVGKTIFESCIKRHLAEKTILLVTHDINILEQCDEVLFFRHGTLVERGAHSQLIKDEQDYYNLMQYNTRKTNQNDNEIMNDIDKYFDDLKASPLKKKPEQLMKKLDLFKDEDEMIIKKAGGESYNLYIKSCGGYILFFIAIFVLLAFAAFQQFATLWLKMWLEEGTHNAETTNNITGYLYNTTETEDEIERNSTNLNDNPDPDDGFYQGILVIIVLATVLIGLLKGFIVTRLVLHGSSSLHNKMFKRVIYRVIEHINPLKFFDNTPVGRIINRFSKDMDELDTRLPFFIEFVLQSAFYVLTSLIIVCMVFPALIFPMVFILGLMIFLDFWLNVGVREAKILDSNLKTPLIHHLQSSTAGLSIIRTFHRQEIFEQRFSAHLDKHLAAEAVFRIANRWFTLRMETVGLITILITLVTSILTRGSQTSAGVGLAISNIYMVCTFVPFVMRMKSELQARFISVERILDYSQNLKSEVDDKENSNSMEESWPANGVIKFESVSFRYAEKLLLALNDINFTVNSHEKIGIVGRTGSGKTSLVAAILRLWPLESGKILIDDIDISQMKLNELRKKISVIPQDPILFHGTIRYNLDPFHEYSDEKIMDCIKKAHLENKILKDEKKLEALVESDGDNFSVGEKQLVCLARALLRENKILILDEATGSLDLETDFLIQSTINSEFKNCTVLTIAHRLNTVSKSDRILVMDKGKVIEIGSPENLMLNSESHFYKLMAASGISNPSATRAK